MQLDLDLVKERFSKAALTYDQEAFVQSLIAKKLSNYLNSQKGIKIFELGCGTGGFSKYIANKFPQSTIYLNDLSAKMLDLTALNLGNDLNLNYLLGDGLLRLKEFPSYSFDLICGNCSFQWFHDFKEALILFREKLKQNGQLIFSSFGEHHFIEFNDIFNVSLDYISAIELQNLLESLGFKAEITQEEIITHFPNIKSLFTHLKRTGVNGIVKTSFSRTYLKDRILAYTKKYSDKDGIYLTWHPIYVKAILSD